MTAKSLKANSLTSQLTEVLEEEILDGSLPLGASLPSETELIRRFGVSRVVVREAVRGLEARGLIQVRQGKRPTVVGLDASMPSDFFRAALRLNTNALLELLEVRRALEMHIARLAAKSATEEDLRSMQETIDTMRLKSKAAADDSEGFDDADAEFHQRLAVATGNRLMCLLVEALREPLRASRTASHSGRFARGFDDTAPIAAHQKILDRVAVADAEGAAAAMRQHLEESKEDLLSSVGGASLRPSGESPPLKR